MPVTRAWTDPNSLDLTTNQVLTQTIWENLLGGLLWLLGTTGILLTWTPTMFQSGSLTLSVATGWYVQFGPLVIGTADVTINSTGTSGQPIILSALPVVSQQRGAGCFGWYLRSGVGFTSVAGVWVTSQQLKFYNGVSVADALGASPAFSAAANDQLHVCFVYQS